MRKKDDQKTDNILNAAADLIITDGPASLSTTKVAKRVGIAQSNIYLYFKNKQEMIDRVYEREISRINQTTYMHVVFDDNSPITNRLAAYIRSLYEYSIKYPTGLSLLEQIKFMLSVQPNSPTTDKEYGIPIYSMFNSGINAGVIKNIHPTLLTSLAFNVIRTHTENIQKGVYTQTEIGMIPVAQLIWESISDTPFPEELFTK